MSVLCLRDSLVPPALQSCVAVGANGVPRFWAAVHDATELMMLAKSSRRTALAGIDAFYAHVEETHGADALDRLLTELNIDEISCTLEGFLMREQNIAAARGSLQEVDGIRQRLQDLERRFRPQTLAPPRQKTLRALPSGVLQDLYKIFDPESERNPFRSGAERFRNYTLFHVLMRCGLRAGEALLLPVNCVRSEHDPSLLRDRHWMTVRNMLDDATETDPRASAPSLKNAYAVRQLPVTDGVAALIRDFSTKHRRATSDTDALFVSNRGRPLSKRTLESACAELARNASQLRNVIHYFDDYAELERVVRIEEPQRRIRLNCVTSVLEVDSFPTPHRNLCTLSLSLACRARPRGHARPFRTSYPFTGIQDATEI